MWILIYRHNVTREIMLVDEREAKNVISLVGSNQWSLIGRTRFNLFDEGDNELPSE